MDATIPLQLRRALRSQRVVTSTGVRQGCVVFEDERIVAVENFALEPGTMPVLDVGDLYILPGLVDTHTHINSPGRSEWEGFATACRAGAAGGYTCLVDMPLNCVPATTNLFALEQKREAAAGACLVDYAFWGGAVKGNESDLLPLARAGVKGFKAFFVDSGVPEFSAVSEEDLRQAMPVIARSGLPLLVHAEHPDVIANAQSNISGDSRRYATYLQSRPDEAETRAIEQLIALCREFACPVHIVHLASAEAIPPIQRARAEGLPLTVETCPHYLHFAAEDIADGVTQCKCAPPIREAATRERLWEALRDGVIDLIATDHSPCPPAMKLLEDGDFLRAWGGISSLSLALPAVWSGALRRGFEIADIVRWMAEKTAKLAGLGARKGRLAAGYDADFVVFDPDEQWVVRAQDLHFRHAVTPYLGEQLRGRVKMTYLRGTLIYKDGNFPDAPRGSECRVDGWTAL